MASGNKKAAQQQSQAAKTVEPPAARPGPGRPPGRPNIDYLPCVVVPAKCRKCGSTEFGHRQHIVTRQISGSMNGHEYNCVSHYRCRCASEACQQALVLIEYRLIPPASEEAGYDAPPTADAGESEYEIDALDALLAEEAGT